MAYCEKCGSSGHDMRNMTATAEKQFIGPCCVSGDPSKFFEKAEVSSYGIEFSSHIGLRAYITYGGLALEFKKTKEELNQWMSPRSQEQELPPDETTTEQTTSPTMN